MHDCVHVGDCGYPRNPAIMERSASYKEGVESPDPPHTTINVAGEGVGAGDAPVAAPAPEADGDFTPAPKPAAPAAPAAPVPPPAAEPPAFRFLPLLRKIHSRVPNLEGYGLFIAKYACYTTTRLAAALSFVVVAHVIAEDFDVDNITDEQYGVFAGVGVLHISGMLAVPLTLLAVDDLKEKLQVDMAAGVLQKVRRHQHRERGRTGERENGRQGDRETGRQGEGEGERDRERGRGGVELVE